MKTKIPDFLIVGSAKAGTTSVHNYLAHHPNVIMPNKIKELNFWHVFGHKEERAIVRTNSKLPVTIDQYEQFFVPKHSWEIYGEVSPSYLYYYEDTIKNIKKLHDNYKNLKIIILIREPLEKIWSHYQFIKDKKLDPKGYNFKKLIQTENKRISNNSLLPDLFLVANTLYYKPVSHYVSNFKSLKILLYDDLKENTTFFYMELCKFLGIEFFLPPNINRVYNKSKIAYINYMPEFIAKVGFGKYFPEGLRTVARRALIKEEKMSIKLKRSLAKIFYDDIQKLNYLVDVDLDSWINKYKRIMDGYS